MTFRDDLKAEIAIKLSSRSDPEFDAGRMASVLNDIIDKIPVTGLDVVNLSTDVEGNLPAANLNGGTDAGAGTFWCGDETWKAPPVVDLSSNDVTGDLPKERLNGGTDASATTFWCGDETWKTPAATPNEILVPCLVSELPAANTAGAGKRGFVTDATATTFASTVAGTGSDKVPVYSDGTDWKIG